VSDDRTLARLAEEAIERRGDYPAVSFEGEWHGSSALHDRATRAGRGLAENGVRPGDRVVVLMENSPDVGVAYNAIARAGAVVTPAVFLLTVAELGRIFADCEPAVVIASELFRDNAVAAGAARVVTVDELARAEPGSIVPRSDDDLAALVYTGGTTGRSKGVMLTNANLWESGRRATEAGRVEGITRSLTALPLSHAFGLLVLMVGLHEPERHTGVLMRWFNPEAWLELAQEHRTQIAAVVPSMMQMLLAEPLEEYDLSELAFVASGAAPLAAETRDAFERRVPGVRVREGYGLTESSALCTTNPPGAIRPGTVGVPVPGTEVRIVGLDGAEAPAGEAGEICIRSGLVMAGYWNAPDLTAETIRDGWLYTGDIGRFDEDGYLTIVDRKKDLILRGGFNVFPRDVEEALLEHPAVTGACVIGRADERLGEEVVAFVTVAQGAGVAGEELVAFGKDRLGGYKYPREVHVLPALPLTPVGKADRKALRELLQTERSV
jgi:long-chain acyl-CoA synthetase